MNFVFISPSFPYSYWNFCDRLSRRGVNVMGIGEDSYDALDGRLKGALREYYRVSKMENYDEMVKAVGYFTYRYGKIDWLESNNEYWMHQDARLRTDFNIVTGPRLDQIDSYQNKAMMKEFYRRAGVAAARYVLSTDPLEKALDFASRVGYPLISKPIVGVGASDTYRLENEEQLKAFFAAPPRDSHIIEEFVKGDLISFDGIVNQDGRIIFAANHVFPQQIMDVVNEQQSVSYWNNRHIPDDLFETGSRVVEASGIRGRFFHNEYFRLTEDKEGLGKKGDLCGLEVNERPPGGYTPDMMDFSDDIDVYDVYARMVSENIVLDPRKDKKYFVCYVGRRDAARYARSSQDILAEYGRAVVWHDRMPKIIARAMGDEFFMARFQEEKEMQEFVRSAME